MNLETHFEINCNLAHYYLFDELQIYKMVLGDLHNEHIVDDDKRSFRDSSSMIKLVERRHKTNNNGLKF